MPCYVACVQCKSGELLNLLEYIPKRRKTFTLQLILANAMTNDLLLCTTYTYTSRVHLIIAAVRVYTTIPNENHFCIAYSIWGLFMGHCVRKITHACVGLLHLETQTHDPLVSQDATNPLSHILLTSIRPSSIWKRGIYDGYFSRR